MLPKWSNFSAFLNEMMEPYRAYHFLIVMACLTHSVFPLWIKAIVIPLATINMVYHRDLLEKTSCWIYTVTIALSVFFEYFTAANHIFLLFYLSLFMAMWRQGWLAYFNFPRYLVALVLTIATFHKLASPHFMNGSLMGEYILSGNSFVVLGNYIFPELPTLVSGYNDVFLHLESPNLSTLATESVVIPEKIALSLKYFSWFIALVEILVSALLIFGKPRFRYLFLIVFLLGTALFRAEYFFFGTLCLLCYLDEDVHRARLDKFFSLAFVVFMLMYVLHIYDYLYA
jgi:hypothetical protein